MIWSVKYRGSRRGSRGAADGQRCARPCLSPHLSDQQAQKLTSVFEPSPRALNSMLGLSTQASKKNHLLNIDSRGCEGRQQTKAKLKLVFELVEGFYV